MHHHKRIRWHGLLSYLLATNQLINESYPSETKYMQVSFKSCACEWCNKTEDLFNEKSFHLKKMRNQTKLKERDLSEKSKNHKNNITIQKNLAKNLKEIFLPCKGRQKKNKLPHATIPTTTKMEEKFLNFLLKKWTATKIKLHSKKYQLNTSIPVLTSPHMLLFPCNHSNVAFLTVASKHYRLDINSQFYHPEPTIQGYCHSSFPMLPSPTRTKMKKIFLIIFSEKLYNNMKEDHRKTSTNSKVPSPC